MPKSSPQKLAYQKAYNARPDIVNRREDNNLARAQMMRAGKVKKGDGKDVAHVKALDNGGGGSASNLKVESASKNRGWRKASGYKVPTDK
jgi:hypothetical protein